MIELKDFFDLNKVEFSDEELEAPYEEPSTTETWKDIKGYEGRYQVSNIGRVKSLERTGTRKNGRKFSVKERILKPKTERTGYLRVNLFDYSGKMKTLLVHRLVCEAFHENPQNKSEVNHINEDKSDNRDCNLEWVTRKENLTHGTRPARMAEALGKPVGQYTLDGKLIKVWKSAMEVYRQLGFDNSYIGATARGKHNIAYGYVWKYIDEDS